MLNKTAFIFLTVSLLLINSLNSYATHLRAGEITVTRQDPDSRDVYITLKLFTNTEGTDIKVGGKNSILDFGDGSAPEFVPEQQKGTVYDGFITVVVYHTTHSYTSPGTYTISFREPNRNKKVLNMDRPDYTQFYIETTVDLNIYNHPLQLSVPPVDGGCTGVIWTHNAGATDADGDLLAYELVTPFQGKSHEVDGYKDPSTFGALNSVGTGMPTFDIDKNTGTLTWDAPGVVGEYNIAFIIKELRVIDGVLREIGRVRRDMQIEIEKCENKRPELIIPNDTCVEAGAVIKNKYIIGTDTQEVKLEAFSDIFKPQLAPEQFPATITPDIIASPAFRPSPDKVTFEWNTKCLHVRERPYQIVFKVSDKSVNKLATFKTWLITVVGPAPKWQNVTVNIAKPSASLEWKSYQCQNADTMQVWRRVDSVAFKPDNCQTGMPSNLGYRLIAEVPIKGSNKFVDTNNGKGLAPGAVYCYRLVAVYPLQGGKSYVSTDTCIGPIVTNAPIITNVTVDSTDIAAGKITVRWVKPLTALKTDVPQYKILRGEGFEGAASLLAPLNSPTDTFFIDEGLNTKEKIYNYQIIANNDNVIDTSAVASSVRLGNQPLIKKIQLDWIANVPWSIQTENYPYHLIFRGLQHADGSTRLSDLQLIDSVKVTTDGFTYLDQGQFKNLPLQDDLKYCYAVITRGSYGNKKIKEPLINYSQILVAQTGDSIPPCKLSPPLRSTLDFTDCEDYFQKYGCTSSFYRNIITWNRPEDEACRNEIVGYKLFFTSYVGGKYIELFRAGILKDTVYIDTLFRSYARCYKVAAVDRSGNVGELSEPLCIDNCTNYELPNVFTPNGIGDACNENFSAYSDRDIINNQENKGITTKCQDLSVNDKKLKCPHFVKEVNFRVYNRWGNEVFTYSYRGLENDPNDGKHGVYIDWDGHDNHGNELAPAVYYYIAEVTFDVVDPAGKVKVLKGWVHLIR